MALIARHAIPHGGVPAPSLPFPSRRAFAIGAAVLFLVLLVDAMLHPRTGFDLWAMHRIQAVDVRGLSGLIWAVEIVTDSSGAVATWIAVVTGFVVARWWVPAMAAATLPIGGVVNLAVGELLVTRTRPHLEELTRTSGNWEERSFPSGHVMGAVMLYGLLVVVARRFAFAPLRLTIQGLSLATIAVVGFGRVWDGAHWPTDVLAAYALGGLLLTGLLAAYARVDATVGHLPLLRAAPLPHDEGRPHAHALTSLVLFDEATVTKVYAPGLLPTVLYWLAFQAPFPYAHGRAALEAALERRNLVGLLTEYWYGSSRVARALGVREVGGRPALVAARVAGGPPADRHAARWFLRGLRVRFEQAGLPTWQIDPRQPRALDNLLETADGSYRVVDLESGLVSPLASGRTWLRALRRGQLPLFDDLFFDVTRAYVAREEGSMRARHGAAWVAALSAALDRTEAATRRWHATEPRLWGRLPRALRRVGGAGAWRARAEGRWVEGRTKGAEWIDREIAAWRADERIDDEEAARLRRQVAAPTFQAMLPFLGAHLLLSVPLRFPLGSIVRPVLVVGALSLAAGRRLAGTTDGDAWRLAREIHSPLVALLAAVPGIGSFAYLAARPVRANRLLLRLLADAALSYLPWRLYERTGLRRAVARPVTAAPSPPARPTPLPAEAAAWNDRLAPAAYAD